MRDVSLLIMFIGLILTMSCQDEISAQHIDSLFGDEYKELIMENDKACALTQRLVDYMGNTYPLYYGGSYIDKNQRLVVLVVDSLLHEQSKLLNVLKKDEFVVKPCKYSYRELIQVSDSVGKMLTDTTRSVCKNVLLTALFTEENRIKVFLKEYSESRIAEFKREIMDSPVLEFTQGTIVFHGAERKHNLIAK